MLRCLPPAFCLLPPQSNWLISNLRVCLFVCMSERECLCETESVCECCCCVSVAMCDMPQVQFNFCATQLPCHFAYLKFIFPHEIPSPTFPIPFPYPLLPLTYYSKSQGLSCCVAFHFKFTFNCRSVVAGIKFRVPIFGSIAWKFVNADIFRLSIARKANRKPQQKESERLKAAKKKQCKKFCLASRSQDTLPDI